MYRAPNPPFWLVCCIIHKHYSSKLWKNDAKGGNDMKKVLWGTALLLVIIFSYSGITNAFFGGSTPNAPIFESFSLLVLGAGLIGIASWGRKKYR